MFSVDKPVYVTRAIAEELPAEHQLFLYQFVLNHHALMTDYLQVFKFYAEEGNQFVIQSQEEPEKKNSHSCAITGRSTYSFNCVDDGSG